MRLLPKRTFAPHSSPRISHQIYTFFCVLFTISSVRIDNWLGQTPKDGFSARIRFYHLPNNRRLRRYTATSIPFAALSGRIRYYRDNAFTGPVSSASVSLTEHARARLPVSSYALVRGYRGGVLCEWTRTSQPGARFNTRRHRVDTLKGSFRPEGRGLSWNVIEPLTGLESVSANHTLSTDRYRSPVNTVFMD